ncbi:hypothetical protein pipiens_011252 [Culex pipiens pipiens]|uniref:Uncharacterized protein n=1 Tax=Culex pipiens pipiens TaxID=38569 RepID=A0ABD1D723_CULPP
MGCRLRRRIVTDAVSKSAPGEYSSTVNVNENILQNMYVRAVFRERMCTADRNDRLQTLPVVRLFASAV